MDKHYTICMGRQIGAGGRGIAALVSESLGVNIYDRTLLKSASQETGFSEEVFEKADEEKTRRGLRSMFMSHIHADVSANCLSVENIFSMQSEVIRNIHAQEDCIFIGRCADYVLRDSDRLLSVFISASPEYRIKRIMEKGGLSERKARSMMEEADRKRASYYNYFTGRSWGMPESYDICLNSSVLGDSKCAEMIVALAKERLGI